MSAFNGSVSILFNDRLSILRPIPSPVINIPSKNVENFEIPSQKDHTAGSSALLESRCLEQHCWERSRVSRACTMRVRWDGFSLASPRSPRRTDDREQIFSPLENEHPGTQGPNERGLGSCERKREDWEAQGPKAATTVHLIFTRYVSCTISVFITNGGFGGGGSGCGWGDFFDKLHERLLCSETELLANSSQLMGQRTLTNLSPMVRQLYN